MLLLPPLLLAEAPLALVSPEAPQQQQEQQQQQRRLVLRLLCLATSICRS
jgi:hypothetical protein